MCLGQVLNVNVVPNARSVWCRVVIAEDRELDPTQGGQQHGRDEVGLGVVIFAVAIAGTRGIEVAKRYAPQPVGRAIPGKGALECALGLAVGIDGVWVRILRDGTPIRRAIHGRTGAEHQPRDAGSAGCLEQVDSARDVVAVIARGIADGLPHQRTRAAVEDRIDAFALQEASDQSLVTVARDAQPGARGHRRAPAGRKVVEDDRVVAGREERLDRHGPDVARAAGDQDVHGASKGISGHAQGGGR